MFYITKLFNKTKFTENVQRFQPTMQPDKLHCNQFNSRYKSDIRMLHAEKKEVLQSRKLALRISGNNKISNILRQIISFTPFE